METPTRGIVSTKNKVLAHERENIPTVVHNASDFQAPQSGIFKTSNRILSHEQAYDAQQAEQAQQTTMLEKLKAILTNIIVTPTLNIIVGQTYVKGWLNVDGATIYSGLGSPAGVVVANQGSLFLRRDGGTSTTLYVKTSGNGTTSGWTAK